MASSTSVILLHYSFICFLLLSSFPFHLTANSAVHSDHHHLNALVLPVTKHELQHQFITRIHQRTPLVPISIVLDLSGQFLWVSCDEPNYNSTSYIAAACQSPECSMARSFSKHNDNDDDMFSAVDCDDMVCRLRITNVFSGKTSVGKLCHDFLSIPSTNGLNPGSLVSTSQFMFSSALGNLSHGLAAGSQGVAGLGKSIFALPKQLSTAFNISKKFAICLPPSTSANGVMFFGDGPYAMFPGIDISKLFTYTPLVKHLDEYYFGIKSIQLNSKVVGIDPSLLIYNKKLKKGGTKISTRNPYMVMRSDIYNVFIDLYVEEAKIGNATRVKGVGPFDACFNTKVTDEHGVTYGVAMPTIDLVLQAEEVFWRIFEPNSMVQIGKEEEDVVCLGILDGGVHQREAIVIGSHQLEDNMLQFDLELNRLGFTSSLLLRQTSCSNFNFTSFV